MEYKEIYLPEEYKGKRTKQERTRRKMICVLLAVIIGISLTGSIVRGKQVQEKEQEVQMALAEEVLRFHVLANSDSEKDQALKMKVKEEVLNYMKKEMPQVSDADEAKEWAREHLKQIEEIAEETVRKEGFGYQVEAQVTTCEFPDKTYGDVTFPAGTYEALRIEIGEARGQNWWCVLYPNLCFLDAVNAVVPEEGKEELKNVLTEEEYEMVTVGSKFRVKWFFLGE